LSPSERGNVASSQRGATFGKLTTASGTLPREIFGSTPGECQESARSQAPQRPVWCFGNSNHGFSLPEAVTETDGSRWVFPSIMFRVIRISAGGCSQFPMMRMTFRSSESKTSHLGKCDGGLLKQMTDTKLTNDAGTFAGNDQYA
jgi:hypothetical protein